MEFFHVGACADNKDNAKFGIYLYRNAIPRELNIPERLEEAIGDSTHDLFKWSEAMVGYNVKMPDYRDCVDLKMSPSHWQYLTPEFEEVKKCYDDVEVNLKKCLTHYESLYNFKMDYMEAINFIRYNPGQHFAVHADHGFSYTCTLSSVMYLNDDYEGGELWFPYLNINFKPQAGDIILFPSTYIYAHSSLKVKSGVKYSAVTMFDYNDNNHKHGIGYGGDGNKITENVGISKADNVPLTYPQPA
jgi:signal peptidase I